MNKVYVQVKNGFPINVDIQNAIDGFEYLGYDIVPFTIEDVLAGKYDRISKIAPFVGSIDAMKQIFKRINKTPEPIDFPQEIIDSGLLFRTIKTIPLNDAIDTFKSDNIPVFIKPVKTKLFDGVLISEESHLSYFRGLENPMVIVCDKIDIMSEFRAYVYKNELVYCCNYSGDIRKNPNYEYIDLLISTYKNAPISYTVDVAKINGPKTKEEESRCIDFVDFKIFAQPTRGYVDERNHDNSQIALYNTVIEFNDFWAIGSYGLKPWDYAQMLLDRYFEIIK